MHRVRTILNKLKKRDKKLDEQGFTLTELVVTVALLGILGAVTVSMFSGTVTESARSLAFSKTAENIAMSWSGITVNQGAPTTITGAAAGTVPQNNNTAMDVIVGGRDFVNAAYTRAYDLSGLRPMESVIDATTAPVAGTSAGAYELKNVPVTIQSVASNYITVRFTNVTEELAKAIWEDNMGGIAWADAAVTSGKIRHGVLASGIVPTLDFVLPL